MNQLLRTTYKRRETLVIITFQLHYFVITTTLQFNIYDSWVAFFNQFQWFFNKSYCWPFAALIEQIIINLFNRPVSTLVSSVILNKAVLINRMLLILNVHNVFCFSPIPNRDSERTIMCISSSVRFTDSNYCCGLVCVRSDFVLSQHCDFLVFTPFVVCFEKSITFSLSLKQLLVVSRILLKIIFTILYTRLLSKLQPFGRLTLQNEQFSIPWLEFI